MADLLDAIVQQVRVVGLGALRYALIMQQVRMHEKAAHERGSPPPTARRRRSARSPTRCSEPASFPSRQRQTCSDAVALPTRSPSVQAIYHREPPTLPHPHDIHLAHAMSRVDSYSSNEPLSPDSMFTLISTWKHQRASTALSSGATGGLQVRLGALARPVLPCGACACAPMGGHRGPAGAPLLCTCVSK